MKKIISIILCAVLLLSLFNILLISDAAGKNGWQKSGDSWYYYSEGTVKTGWSKINSKWYYFDGNGKMLTGWQKSGGKWYYLNTSGEMLTGWQKINNKWYYLEQSGAMKTGWLLYSSKWYFLTDSGAMKTGWLLYKSKWYYLDSSGAMKTGWLNYNGNSYYLDETGFMYENCSVVISGKTYYFGSDGIYLYCKETEEKQYTFANNDRLNEHYEKHGIEMGYASAEDYLAGANAVINNPDALVKNGSENDTLYYIESTNEIVFLSEYGKIRTYFICSGKDYFDKQ